MYTGMHSHPFPGNLRFQELLLTPRVFFSVQNRELISLEAGLVSFSLLLRAAPQNPCLELGSPSLPFPPEETL